MSSERPDNDDAEQFLRKQREPALTLAHTANAPADFHEVLREIGDISGKWNAVEIFTPDAASIDREQKAFFQAFDEGKDYLPSFEYGTAKRFDIDGARERLNALMRRVLGWVPSLRVEQLARVALRAKLMDDLATCDLVEGIRTGDDARVKSAMNQKYQPLDDSLLALEDKELEDLIAYRPSADETPSPHRFTPEQVAFLKKKMLAPEEQEALFTWALKTYGILRDERNDIGFKVEVTDDVQFLDVRHRSLKGPTVFLKRKPMSAYTAILLLRHEIEGHARQVSNGQKLFGLGGGALTLDDETLYEGLAMRLETEAQKEYFGEEPPDPRFYGYAVKLAEEGKGFAEIFRDQYERTLHVLLKLPWDAPLPADISAEHREEAKRIGWRTTYRVMRGHTDMSNEQAFAMRKDIGYARGLEQDKKLREADKGHYNEVAVIAKGGLQMLGEFALTPQDLPFPDRNLTRVFADAIRDMFKRQGVIDVQSFVRSESRRILGGSGFDVLG